MHLLPHDDHTFSQRAFIMLQAENVPFIEIPSLPQQSSPEVYIHYTHPTHRDNDVSLQTGFQVLSSSFPGKECPYISTN